MLQARKIAFWLSVLAALLGGLGAYWFAEPKGTEVGATQAETATEEATSTVPKAVEEEASSLGIVAAVLFSLVAFSAAWHGGAVSATDEPLSAAPLWGLIPALLIAASGGVLVLLLLWVFKNPQLLKVISWSLPLAICAGLAWELGYLGVRPWAPKSSEAAHGHAKFT